MNKHHFLTAALLIVGGLMTSQVALAHQDGEIVVRGGFAQADVESSNASLTGHYSRLDVTVPRGLYDRLGYRLSDRLGIELSGQEALDTLDVRRRYGAAGQLGIDLAGEEIGDTRLGPTPLGGGTTYHF